MTAWEYRILEVGTSSTTELQAELCGLGSIGWEAVAYTGIEKFGPNTVSVLLKREAPALSPPDDLEPGWKPDPLERFEVRAWDGQRWTERVMRDGIRELDFPDTR